MEERWKGSERWLGALGGRNRGMLALRGVASAGDVADALEAKLGVATDRSVTSTTSSCIIGGEVGWFCKVTWERCGVGWTAEVNGVGTCGRMEASSSVESSLSSTTTTEVAAV